MADYPALPVTHVDGVVLTDDAEHCLIHLRTEAGRLAVALPVQEIGRLGALLLGVQTLHQELQPGDQVETFAVDLNGWTIAWTARGDAVLGIEMAGGARLSFRIDRTSVETFRNSFRRLDPL